MLELLDRDVLIQAIEGVTNLDAVEVLVKLTGSTADAVADIAALCSLDHCAVLVFPDDPGDVVAFLADRGLTVDSPVPSVVVRQRLAHRYDRDPAAVDVSIVFGTHEPAPGITRGIEVFTMPRGLAGAALVDRERKQRNEFHVALRVRDADALTVRALRSVLLDRFGLTPDGGGYNPCHGKETGGRSVLYFSTPHGRLEITCAGNVSTVVAEHVQDEHAPVHRLLDILSGQWAARAVYAATKLRIADILADGPCSAGELAARVGSDTDAMARLLRYLEHLNVVWQDATARYRLGDLGRLLRSGTPTCALTTLYEEEFRQAWSSFVPAVQTGRTAFGLAFGAEHFDYFSSRPTLSRRFDLAMAAVTGRIAERVVSEYGFQPDATVVDVGGGDGTLLHAILRANPTTRGILVDAARVLTRLASRPDTADRLTPHPGDFFEEVPAGHDVYVLSRVLHDWPDAECVRILEVCRAACHPSSALLVVERLLPEHTGDSLARAWDMQMLAITGGRERPLADYQRLMTKTGFLIREVRDLSLDLKLLVCEPHRPDR